MDGSRLPTGKGTGSGWRLVTWLILGWTGLMGLLAYVTSIGAVGLDIGLTLIFGTWFAGFIVLSVIWFMTKPDGGVDVPTVRGDEMKTRNSMHRAAGVVLAVTGGFLLVFTAVGLAPAVSDLGAGDSHLAGDATITLMIAGPVLAAVVLSTLCCAWLLWRGSRGATVLALVWVVTAGLFARGTLSADIGYGPVDPWTFWLARVLAIAAIAVTVLLLAGWILKAPKSELSG